MQHSIGRPEVRQYNGRRIMNHNPYTCYLRNNMYSHIDGSGIHFDETYPTPWGIDFEENFFFPDCIGILVRTKWFAEQSNCQYTKVNSCFK